MAGRAKLSAAIWETQMKFWSAAARDFLQIEPPWQTPLEFVLPHGRRA
jgi:hypothetical protein